MAAKKLQTFIAGNAGLQMPQTGIPIIIRPFVVKKAYAVHPKVTAFQADLKAQWLTKTCLVKGLPSACLEYGSEISTERLKYVKESIEKSLIQTVASQKMGQRWKMRYDVDLTEGLLQSMLLPCWYLADHMKESFLDFRPSIKTHWCRNHDFYQIHFNVGYILRARKPLPVFRQDISDTSNLDLPGPYSPMELRVFRHPTIHLPNSPGYQKDQRMIHPHTMFLPDYMSQNQEQMIHHGIQVMFSQLAAIAMNQGYYPGEHLAEPLSTKCVVTNGRVYLFMAYQLNTLSLQEDFGIKNLAWYEDMMTLYDASRDPFKKGRATFYEVFPNSKRTLEINEQCITTLVSFLTQKTQE